MKKRKNGGRMWLPQLIFALLAIAVLLAVAFMLYRAGAALLNADFSASEPDPMFAEPAETVTRPPELDAEEEAPPHPTLDDYVPAVETPVDKTAAELIEEAQNGN